MRQGGNWRAQVRGGEGGGEMKAARCAEKKEGEKREGREREGFGMKEKMK